MVENEEHIEGEPLHEGFSIEDLPSVREGHVRVISKEEGMEMVDRLAHRYFDMSGEEFICAWESGEFDDDPDAPHVMHLVMLIPFAK